MKINPLEGKALKLDYSKNDEYSLHSITKKQTVCLINSINILLILLTYIDMLTSENSEQRIQIYKYLLFWIKELPTIYKLDKYYYGNQQAIPILFKEYSELNLYSHIAWHRGKLD